MSTQVAPSSSTPPTGLPVPEDHHLFLCPVNYAKPDCEAPNTPVYLGSAPESGGIIDIDELDSPYYLPHEMGPNPYPPFFPITPPNAGANGMQDDDDDDDSSVDEDKPPTRRAIFFSPLPKKARLSSYGPRDPSHVPSPLDEY